MIMNPGANGKSESRPLSEIGKTSLSLFKENEALIAALVDELSKLMPCGASYLFALRDGAPTLVTAGNLPLGEQTELIFVARPATFLAQQFIRKQST